MKPVMLRADQLRVGHFIIVNGKPQRVTRTERLIDGRITFSFDGYQTGILCKDNTLLPVMFPNVRFWIYWGEDCVKLTLTPGQAIEIGYGSPTDEGWSSHFEKYEYDAEEGVVQCEIVDDGSDCDGRLTSFWNGECAISRLASMDMVDSEFEPNGLRQPDWVEQGRSQRDEFAEMAGY